MDEQVISAFREAYGKESQQKEFMQDVGYAVVCQVVGPDKKADDTKYNDAYGARVLGWARRVFTGCVYPQHGDIDKLSRDFERTVSEMEDAKQFMVDTGYRMMYLLLNRHKRNPYAVDGLPVADSYEDKVNTLAHDVLGLPVIFCG